MQVPTPDDFDTIEKWGLIENPRAAIEDYSDQKADRRDENERHLRACREYKDSLSESFVADTQSYYRSMERPIDRTKWSFLKLRKAWFHPPVGWNQFAAPGVSRIVDIGCGDGDITQLIADHIASTWLRAGYDGFPLEIVGIDLNDTRIRNARRHTESPHKKITLRFEQGDILDGVGYKQHYFDYAVLAGLLEVLNDNQAETTLDEVTRLTARGVYVRDVLEAYPGITPRPELPAMLEERGFTVESRDRVFEEPFTDEGTKDPLDIWPINVNQVVFGQRENPVPPEQRY